MASETRSATVFINDASIGGRNWLNPGDAAASDDDDAAVFLDDATFPQSAYLKATAFGYTLPSATIEGIEIKLERAENTDSNGDIQDNSAKMVRDGTIEGDEMANTGVNWPTSDTVFTYGGPTELHGLTWTVAQINASDFGWVISALYDGVPGDRTAEIDHITITVYYTEMGPINEEAGNTIMN